ncbi:ABC transporter ATP-binding protein [Phytohabitans suffuscus]|uniref:ABC transporter n=1 Tax=Phytohabitans suffuscus TaxID=624315 RepID=A0A6F8YGC3_9ACTN|nr:ABC transporter ATP-binding protein [Phytohabitans suffuscus]BCB84991.1 ABC transporter [Phytohabitans suffuscus]
MVALAVVGSVLEVVPALFAGFVIDAIIAGAPATRVTALAALATAPALVAVAVDLHLARRSAQVGEGIVGDLRRDMVRSLHRQSVSFFRHASTGALATRLSGDVSGVQRVFGSSVITAVGATTQLIVATTAMLAMSWQVGVVVLATAPLFLLPVWRLGDRMAGLQQRWMDARVDYVNLASERFSAQGATLSRSFGRLQEDEADLGSRADRLKAAGIDNAVVMQRFTAAMTLVPAVATFAVYAVGGALASSRTVQPGAVVTLALLITRLYGPLAALTAVRAGFADASVAFDRAAEILSLPSRNSAPLVTHASPRAMSVEFREVRFAYGHAEDEVPASLLATGGAAGSERQQVLDGTTFRIPAGRVAALVGASGAGKSTVAALLAGLCRPDEGSVLIDGIDLRDLETAAGAAGYVACLSQDSYLFNDTVAANLRYARPDATDDELWSVLGMACIADLVASLPDRLETVAGESGYRFSGGERQRLAIARMLLRPAGIVVLDEATAHLDTASEAAVQAAVNDALGGRTALIIAHRLSTIVRADVIFVLDEGVIVEQGDHATLLARSGRYAQLYRGQIGDGDRP